MNEKFLIVGLDGLSWDLFNQLVKKRSFEKLSRGINQGVQNKLDSTIPSVTYAALPSFMTGKTPLKISHGVLSGEKIIRDFSKMNDKAFWEFDDLKSCIVNLRCTYKPRKLNGKMITGSLYTPSEESDYTYPKELKSDVKGFHEKLRTLSNPESLEGYTETLKKDTKMKLDFFKKIIFEENFDISLFWDGNMDFLLHFKWGKWGEIEEYVKIIDKEISKIYEKTNARNVILLSDHGFDRKHRYDFYLNVWLKNKSYLKMKRFYRIGKINSLIYKWAMKNRRFGRIVSKFTSKKEESDFPFSRRFPGVDYRKTIAQAPKAHWGIELNFEELDEKKYEDFRSEIINKLENVTHNGRKIFKNIWTSEELYGESTYGKKISDIFFVTDPKYKCVPPIGNKIISRVVKTDSKRTGGHDNSPQAFFAAFGEDIRKKFPEEKFKIYDLAPTILHYFDIPIPQNIDGRVLKEIFKEDSEAYRRSVKYAKSGEREKLDNIIKNLKL